MFDFTGKTALITGAGSGIGRATAAYFHECGANVVLADINAAAVQEAAGALDGRASHCRYDAGDPQSAEAAVAHAVDRFGGIDHLVLAAGIYEQQLLEGMTDAQWHRMIAVNLDGAFYITRASVPHMRDGGAIVAIASVAGHQGGSFGHTHYGASKGGILAFTRGVARDLAPRIRANAIAPGWIDTPMVAKTLESSGAAKVKAIPLQRVGQPREIASIAAFLCSDASSFVTGESIIAAGGAYMG
ncbi:SDR family NAD(P)-dependent oxidoreductase [Paracoccus pantotrophus]|uniref:SDR family NAD(P)-dependent oxidoreductase n=1 Tax=Paracoccus pantotrophus TaxID=82367 RepID=UPI00048F5325|nr:SDR family NAD(P)-dependent oxidoreductase [Paracoccus pantotrophus]